jgi:hypothetical protein
MLAANMNDLAAGAPSAAATAASANVVPEPTGMGLLMLAVGGIAIRRRARCAR